MIKQSKVNKLKNRKNNQTNTSMKNKTLISAAASLVLLGLSSCEVIGGIFKAGVWVGVLIVVGIIGLIVYLISKSGKNN